MSPRTDSSEHLESVSNTARSPLKPLRLHYDQFPSPSISCQRAPLTSFSLASSFFWTKELDEFEVKHPKRSHRVHINKFSHTDSGVSLLSYRNSHELYNREKVSMSVTVSTIASGPIYYISKIKVNSLYSVLIVYAFNSNVYLFVFMSASVLLHFNKRWSYFHFS